MTTSTIGWDEYPPAAYCGGAVTVGNFDGVHRGHVALVERAKAWAQIVQGPTVAVTFDPAPANVLFSGTAKPPISTLTDRAALLLAAGADRVLVLRTDARLLSLSPEAFFEDILVRQIDAKAIVEGANFRFGRSRLGDTGTLRALGAAAGIPFEEVPPVTVGGEAVSSSRVRAALMAGDVKTAAELLGRPYRLAGVVVSGAKRGRTIGFPTANLDRIETLIPGEGVYAVRAIVDGQSWPAAANIGPNPTFGENARKIEIHLIGFHGDIYGKTLLVEFVLRLRETRPFDGVAALIEQLHADVAQATRILSVGVV